MLCMKTEETPAPDLSPAAVRRRFTAAAWGSAIAWPLLATAAIPALNWWMDIGWQEMLSADYAVAGLLPVAPVILYFAVDALRTVRKEQQKVAENARGLVSAAHRGDPSELRASAHHFGDSLLQARSAFNTRVLPRQATLRFARRVLSEAEAAELSPASLQTARKLAQMTA